ncbi:MAG: undecaprenyl-phosphate glucose phosphotransferase [Gammaproteobacteria bacterium]|nr:undecaprenyl-phosphate glucose phosphotransferase [Gammaproteobacteria bacterium]
MSTLISNNRIHPQRPLLQRRKSLASTLQAAIDGIILILTVYFTFYNFQGFINVLDTIFLIILLAVTGITYDRMGIYRHYGSLLKSVRTLLLAWSISFSITLFVFIMAHYFEQLSSPALPAILIITFSGQLINRLLFIGFQVQTSHSQTDSHNVLLVGSGPLVSHLYDSINSNPWIQEKAIGRIQITKKNEDITVPILGGRENIIDVIRTNRVKTVYIAVSLENSHLAEDIYLDLVGENVDIHWAPDIFSMNLVNHSVKELAGIPLLTLSESPLIGNYRALKAIEDRFIALVSLILLSPLMAVVAVIIKLESPGPAIFKQNRTGWNGEVFPIWKFRSMKINQPNSGTVEQATVNDERFTRVGKFIRKTSIDEIPQLFNVLIGKMSLVGPRPHAVEHNVEYAKRINAYLARHRIKPGITGLAQIHGFRGETDTLGKMEKRVEYDLQYINNWSFWLDIKIMLKTIPALIRDDAY